MRISLRNDGEGTPVPQRQTYGFRFQGANPRPAWQQWLILAIGGAFMLALLILAGMLALLLLPVILVAGWLWRRRMQRMLREMQQRQEEQRRESTRTIEGDYRSLD